MKKLFGTDGIRATLGSFPLRPKDCLKIAQASSLAFSESLDKNSEKICLIAKDTRNSGDFIESILAGGFASLGWRVVLLGVLPTPGLAYLVEKLKASCALMISASHNPPSDNGIKFFSAKGFKIPEQTQKKIESFFININKKQINLSKNFAKIDYQAKKTKIFTDFLKNSYQIINKKKFYLKNFKLIIDAANGASAPFCEDVFKPFVEQLQVIHSNPDGKNINQNCGCTHPEIIKTELKKHSANLAIAFDGDADRIIVCDDKGKILDGDDLLALYTKFYQKYGISSKFTVGTIMSNLSLENYLSEIGCRLLRTQVGDRFVCQKMQETGAFLGGEPSGHIILTNHAKTEIGRAHV